MNTKELLSSKKDLNNSKDIIKDILQGDSEVLKKLDDMHLDMNAIKTAVKFLTDNVKKKKERSKLITESWRINFKSKPPTPEEFVSEKYLGMAADHTYPWVKNVFKEFMDPTKAYRNLILYPH